MTRQRSSTSSSYDSQSGGGSGRLLLGCLMVGAFLPFLYLGGLKPYQVSHASQNWAHTTCKILESKVVQESMEEERVEFQVKYDYLVGGKIYTSTALDPFYPRLAILYNRNLIYSLEREFRKDTEVECFVDLANPSQAVLRKDPPPRFLLFSAFLAVPVIIGILLTVIGVASLLTKRD